MSEKKSRKNKEFKRYLKYPYKSFDKSHNLTFCLRCEVSLLVEKNSWVTQIEVGERNYFARIVVFCL
jgi:hypothetical protein